MVMRVIGIAAVAVVLLGLLAFSQQRREPLKVSGFVEAYEIRVGSRIGGRVKRVDVEEGQHLQAGAPLLELEPYDLNEQAAQARAILAERRAVLTRLQVGYRKEEIAQAHERYNQLAANLKKLQKGPRDQEIKAAEANRDQAQAQLTLARDNHRRAEALFKKGALTQEEMDQATSELKVGQATLDAREENLDLLRAGTRPEELEEAAARLREAEQAWHLQQAGYRPEEIAEAEAAVAAAEAALQAIEEQLAELVVRAPVEAIVEAVDLRPGALVAANTPAISLLDPSQLWVRAYVPENRLRIQVGQKVFVSTDSFPGRKFAGHVSFISDQAEFTPGNVQTPEERSKQVFRIKVMLDEGLRELHPGTPADVWLEEAGTR
jgi:multidrug resistance efflux pump